jgi:hypothetical protein
MNHSIQKRVNWLYYQHGVSREEIIEHLKWKFEDRRYHERYNPNYSCLKTYVLNFCYFGVLSLVRECKKLDNCTAHLNQRGGKDVHVQVIGPAYEPYEVDGVEGLVDTDTPEALMLAKELMQMALDHFGQADLEVLLGVRDRLSEADNLGLSYDAYLKRLHRKRRSFKSILNQAGYID